MKKQDIQILKLILWDQNPRFPEEYFRKTETELIDFLLTKKGEKEKLLELAKSIIDNINEITPWERLIVYKRKNDHIVLEGNRRLMVYKLLLNPELTTIAKAKEFFNEAKSKVKINKNFSLECLVTTDKDKGLKYVELKHLESGYKSWGEPERNNFKRRRGGADEKLIIKTEIDAIVKRLDFPQELKDMILGKGYVTTFYRVIAENAAKDFFGYEADGEQLKIRDKNFEEKLKVIIWDLLKKKDKNGNKLDSRALNKKDDVTKYLASIKNNDFKRVKKETKESETKEETLFGEKNTSIKIGTLSANKKTPRTQKILNELFGGTLTLKKGDTNNIYRDIMDLYTYYLNNKDRLSPSFPSLIRMALRLLVESATKENESISNYIDNNYESAKKTLTKNQKTTLSNNAIEGKKTLKKLMQSGAHNYTNSANFEQTIAMSIIIGAMLKITHKK